MHSPEPDSADAIAARIFQKLDCIGNLLNNLEDESELYQPHPKKELEFCIQDTRSRLYIACGRTDLEKYYFVQLRNSLWIANRRRKYVHSIPVQEYVFSSNGVELFYGGRSYSEFLATTGVKRNTIVGEIIRQRGTGDLHEEPPIITPRTLAPLILCIEGGKPVTKLNYDQPIAGSREKVVLL